MLNLLDRLRIASRLDNPGNFDRFILLTAKLTWKTLDTGIAMTYTSIRRATREHLNKRIRKGFTMTEEAVKTAETTAMEEFRAIEQAMAEALIKGDTVSVVRLAGKLRAHAAAKTVIEAEKAEAETQAAKIKMLAAVVDAQVQKVVVGALVESGLVAIEGSALTAKGDLATVHYTGFALDFSVDGAAVWTNRTPLSKKLTSGHKGGKGKLIPVSTDTLVMLAGTPQELVKAFESAKGDKNTMYGVRTKLLKHYGITKDNFETKLKELHITPNDDAGSEVVEDSAVEGEVESEA